VSLILFPIYTSGLIKWDEEYVPAEGLPFVNDLGWVEMGRNVNQVVRTVERCAAKSIECASRRGLQFETAKTEAAVFTCRQGQKKHLPLKWTAKIMVGNGFIWFNKQVTRCLSIWMDDHLLFKEHHNQCMKNATAAEARLQALTKTYGVVP